MKAKIKRRITKTPDETSPRELALEREQAWHFRCFLDAEANPPLYIITEAIRGVTKLLENAHMGEVPDTDTEVGALIAIRLLNGRLHHCVPSAGIAD